MTPKLQKTGTRSGAPAVEIFRQFAWNLAGTLAKTGTPQKTRPPRASKPAGAR